MRLTHLKIAGFKSFVDSTTIDLYGQRVGIVGPNGCGKSNVMESVRWVLGESSAKELRADAMDAVIFNGSSNRKPISRASVELIFDNDEASRTTGIGEWSQYAQISVKRVIAREKGSTYYINNTAVRKRDVADLFLGTGLGGRAYAIIGQNTISRIVEAKPEELRVFLEEAAGISKYKERRRETATRLQDTRENLTRVDDICRELQKQIARLESQAKVANEFHALEIALKLADGQLWLIKKRDAAKNWARTKAQVDQQENGLEETMAALRKSELALELSRQMHYAASDGINTAQAAYYEANAEVSNLENQVKQNDASRERLTQQHHQINITIERNHINLTATQHNLGFENAALTQANMLEQQVKQHLHALQITLPEKKSSLEASDANVQTAQKTLSELLNNITIENNNINHINNNIDNIQQRISKIKSELSSLDFVSDQQITDAHNASENALSGVSAHEHQIQDLQKNNSHQQLAISHLKEVLNQTQRTLNFTEAELNSLQNIQQSLNGPGKLSDWLNSKALNDNARLWQKMNVDIEWNVALEAVLGAKLNAVVIEENIAYDKSKTFNKPLSIDQPQSFGKTRLPDSVDKIFSGIDIINDRPPGALVLGYSSAIIIDDQEKNNQLTPLSNVINACDDLLKPLLYDWLQGVYLLAATDDLQASIKKLKPGEILVNVKGDMFSPWSVIYHGENSHLDGVLERQHKLDQLLEYLPKLQTQFQIDTDALTIAEKQYQLNKQLQQQEEHKLKLAVQSQHQFQLALFSLQQKQQQAIAREKMILNDLTELNSEIEQLEKDKTHKQDKQNSLTTQVSSLEIAHNEALQLKQKAQNDYVLAQESIRQAEKKYQESTFNLKILNNKINDIKNNINNLHKEILSLNHRRTDVEQQLILVPMDNLKSNLSQSIDLKQLREAQLVTARNHLATLDLSMQDKARAHMQIEQDLHPIRNQLEQCRLDALEARLYFEQCQLGLTENGLAEAILLIDLQENTKASDLTRKISQIEQNISGLGAVNLGAIQELSSETERKNYLDSQLLDLRQATQTLEDAILKIDHETREQLIHTFNTVNRHFNDLFSTLFAGGQAKLELLGNEILDTGLQVFAQPPGKKNTTIALLSGGEKALTAIALVFAMFKLNPAPFCLMDEVDAPLDDSNTERFCNLVKKMSEKTQFLFVSHNKVTMEMAQQLIGVTMQESGVSRIVSVDIDAALAY